ncbi:MAG TPA: TrbI/VirB10 family protein [Ramlibacter sp.]|uniref:TrbI/VirB10 family protein n=1 Tax=Ramlibacter sp. TaxID=1917967 RepID=UPI002C5F5BBD|nr:TrbI/VirB10 family protein [Ramlibacter sp.]HVZ42789.1 TrbI/VirB10 family protein [Ramlibacter sp.]
MAAATSSPDGLQLRSKPKISARLNRKALFVLGGVLAAVVLFVMTNIAHPNTASGGKAGTADQPRSRIVSADSAAAEITNAVPDNTPRIAARPPEVPPLQPEGGQAAASAPGRPNQPPREDQELAQALRSGTALINFVSGTAQPAASAHDASGERESRKDRDSLDIGEPSPSEPDQNRQSRKRDFLQRAAEARPPPYRIARPRAPLSEFEIKTGSIIPATLITQIDSDLPGEIVAQVSQNVFDSATGRHLLIPQGTKLFGQYDSSIAFGQERLMVTWSRLIYPDASTLDLGGMAGIDGQGQAGFGDRVNNHVVRTFGAAVLTSLFSAALQASQPQPVTGGTLTSQQVAAAAMGQQMGQFGMAVANRYLRVQPTIEIRRGHRFAVMVSKDLVFSGPYGEQSPD